MANYLGGEEKGLSNIYFYEPENQEKSKYVQCIDHHYSASNLKSMDSSTLVLSFIATVTTISTNNQAAYDIVTTLF